VSLSAAIAFVGAVRADPALADRLAALGLDPDLERVAAIALEAGFDCTPDELRRAHVHDWGLRWVGRQARRDPG
jgi:predicted ribosomally synthesized peptide with nif11-like leader